MLRDKALNWWDSEATTKDHANEPITWTWFKDLLYDYYFLDTVKNDKEAEFFHLTQGTVTVAQYKKKFTKLSHFGLDVILIEARKIKRFKKACTKKLEDQWILKSQSPTLQQSGVP